MFIENRGPDYSKYTIEELKESLKSIDRESFPERIKIIEAEINLRNGKTKSFESNKVTETKGITISPTGAAFMIQLSIVGFVLSALVHFSTIAGVNTFLSSNYIFALHFGVFIPFFASILSISAQYPNLNKIELNKVFFNQVPKPITALIMLTFIYTCINFLYSMSHLTEGSPNIRDGLYILEKDGSYIRDITFEQYQTLERMIFRGFSGHWLFFYFYPVVYFKYVYKKNK